MDQPIKWHGGKHYLAKWIIPHFPKHVHYVEPYFGGGSVLLQKSSRNVSEVVGDIHRELINFWEVLQEPERFRRLQALLERTPFSERLFEDAGRLLVENPPIGENTQVLSAWWFFIRARQSRQGLMKDFATLSRNRIRRGMNEQASSWLTAIDGLEEVHRRLKSVVILNRPALEVIEQQDGPNTFFYLDPPYLHETRRSVADYQFEMSKKDHAQLLRRLSTIQGKFCLSGYPSDLYDGFAKASGWHVNTCEIDNKASSAATKELKTECLWMNYDWRAR